MVKIVGFSQKVAKKTNADLIEEPMFRNALKFVCGNDPDEMAKFDTKRQAGKFFKGRGYVYNKLMEL